MVWMGVRPGADLAQALDEGQARAAEVDIRNMQGLEAGPAHDAAEVFADRDRVLGGAQGRQRPGVATALGVMQDVDLKLAGPAIQLIAQGAVGIVQPRRLGIDGDHGRQLRLGDRQLVAVVGADHGDVVHPQGIIQPGTGPAADRVQVQGLGGAGSVKGKDQRQHGGASQRSYDE